MKSPKNVSEIYHSLILSYQRCLKGKPSVRKSAFHFDHEKEIFDLADEIYNRRYSPKKSRVFVVFHPKPREIVAANIRDRVVHHFIYDHMEDFYERQFVKNSYACRKSRGPLKAAADLCGFIREFRLHDKRRLYYLKLDIQSFFPSIDLDVLCEIIFKKLKNPLFRYLCYVTIYHRPCAPGCYELASPASAWRVIPRYKSLFYAQKNKGLAIGNLTSQFYANIYLNELDQHIKHHLQGHYLFWQRYVDDLSFIGDDPKKLLDLAEAIDKFLLEKLKLKLNRKKTQHGPLQHGFDHLGFFVKPDHLLVRKKNVAHVKNLIQREGGMGASDLPSLNSLFGFFRHADSYRLRTNIAKKVVEESPDGLWCDEKYQSFKYPMFDKVKEKLAKKEREYYEIFKKSYLAQGGEKKLLPIYLKNWRSLADIMEDWVW